MPADGPAIVKRFKQLTDNAAQFRTRWEKMAPFIAPSRVGITSQRSPGQKQTTGVYDSTMMSAAELMAMFVAGHLINPANRWGGMRMQNPAFREDDEIQEWLEESTDRMMASLAASAFYGESQETTVDWGGFGTGCLVADEAPQPVNRTIRGFRGFHFEAHKIGRYVISDGPTGMADTLMYEKRATAKMLEQKFGKQNCSEKVRNLLNEGKQDEPVDFIHAIYPRPVADSTYAAGSKKMPFASCWVESETKHVLQESGYPSFPAAIPRYLRTPGETFGRGRGDLAFSDQWTLNEAKRLSLEEWTLSIWPPPLVRHDAVIGTLRLMAGTPTVINTHGKSIQDTIQPWQTGTHPEITQLKEEELRKSIRQIFFTDQILMLMEVSKSEMTAFEFGKKMELLFRIMGTGVYGRCEQEFLRPIWEVCWEQMWMAGAFSPPPAQIFDTDGRIETVFENPIARAQRTGDADALQLAIQDLLPLAEIFPQQWDWFDPDKNAKKVMRTRGVGADITRSDAEVKQLRAERQQREEEEQALAQTEQVATAAGKAAPMLALMQGGKSA